MFRDPKGLLSKTECINLIKSDDNMEKVFNKTEYKNDIICFHIFEDLHKYKLIVKGIDYIIEFIKEIDAFVDQTFIWTVIKASRTTDGIIIKDISFPATIELMIDLTKDVGIDFDKNELE